MKKLILFIFLILSYGIHAQNSGIEYSRVRIDMTQTDITEIAELGLEADHGVYQPGKHLINDFSEAEIAILAENNIPYRIEIKDVQKHYREQVAQGYDANIYRGSSSSCNGGSLDDIPGAEYETPENYEFGTMGGYLTYEQFLETMDEMYAAYPNLLTPKTEIGDFVTHEGRPIYWLSISDNPGMDEGEPEILFTSLHHAREPNSLSQLVFFMWYLLENYETDSEVQYLLDNTKILFIPCVNPDGYVYNNLTDPFGGGLWRKNRWAIQPGNVQGVDLNRNYGFQWGIDDIGSSANPANQTYRGPGPFSEPETQAVAYFMNNREIQITLNYHTFGNLLIHPWGYNDQLTVDDQTFKSFAKAMTKQNKYFYGTGSETVGYITNGDSDDWMYGEQDTKPKVFVLTPEAGPPDFGFWPPQDQIDFVNKANCYQNLIATHLLLNYARITDFDLDPLVEVGDQKIQLQKTGLQDGMISVSVESGSDNLTVDFTPLSLQMTHLDEELISIPYEFTPLGSEPFEDAVFLVSIDNGLYSYTDTIRKEFVNGIISTVYSDPVVNLSPWTVEGNWAVTFSDFYSEPKSITESTIGDYENSDYSVITLNEAISLGENEWTILHFWAKWDIENNFDYAQVLASTDGEFFTALCGEYTNLGTDDQDSGQPLYDGVQDEWVRETIILDDYVGQDVYIRFLFVSDDFVTGDGFYFDDIEFEIVNAPEIQCPEPAISNASNIGLTAATLNWDPTFNADEYTLRYRPDSGDWLEVVGTETSYNLENLATCTAYEVQLKSSCGDVESEYSESLSFETECIECLTPNNLTVGMEASTAAQLVWDPVPNIGEYVLRYKNVLEEDWLFHTSSVNVTNIINLEICTDYEVQIRSGCDGEESEFSESMTFKTLCNNTSVGSINGISLVNAFPNPFSENISVDFVLAQSQDLILIELIDQSGKIFYQNKLSDQSTGKKHIEFNTKDLSSGIYFIKISNEKNEELTLKVVNVNIRN